MSSARRVLFTGYAPVHFLCFQPIFERLRREPGVEIHVAGGLREKIDGEYVFHPLAMYLPLGVPSEAILSMDQIAEMDFDLLFAANTKMLKPRSVGACVQVFHGISFRNRAVRKENLGADHFLVAGPYMERKFVEAGLLAQGDPRIVRSGFVKTDRLLNGELDRAQLLRGYGFDGSRPVLLYAPTGQKHCSLDLMGPELVARLKATGKYDIIVKLHDHPHGDDRDWAAEIGALQDQHTILAGSFDVIPLLFLADLLISDASSVSNEYSLLDRPMVFIDVPKLLEKAAKKDGSMMDLATWGRSGGTIVQTAEEAVEAVAAGLAHPERHSEQRRRIAADLFYNPGRATDFAVDWLRREFLQPSAVS
ncbi:MAG: hypothetical protein D6702_05135 [Planctomycetota bacterium]|nr:MAG: hypothetical protein D6702_05135 [Planctomycetota bacterium]